jgi:REP element-mobilizing transposase RayT
MPRKARIDVPGALHHIIVRGIERRRIFSDDQDRDNFIDRLGDIVTETKTFCFGWALIPNHIHILLRTGQTALATVMRSAEGGLTGSAVSYNRRHRRHGHLFQSSLLCYWAVRKLGFSATELSKKLGVSQPSVSISVKRGERIAKAEQLELVEF